MIKNKEIVETREKHGLTRKTFAQKLGVSYETLTRWENGQRKPSKFYQHKIHEFAEENIQFQEEKWILLASNVRHIMDKINEIPSISFGVIQALMDPSRQFFLAYIQLLPQAYNLTDIEIYIKNPKYVYKNQGLRLTGGFLVSDCPFANEKLAILFKDMNINYFALCNRLKKEINVWKISDKNSHILTKRSIYRVPCYTVG